MDRVRDLVATGGVSVVLAQDRFAREYRDGLLEAYAGLVPEAIDALESDERHWAYRMMRMKAYLGADGSLELSGNVISFSGLGISW